MNDVTGVILAGGRSLRFGSNKAFALYQGVPLIERVVNVMRPLFEDLILITNTPGDYARHDLPTFTDLEPYKGPLGGIVTALHYSNCDRIFVVGCDMPILDPGVIAKIIEKGREAEAAIPVHDGIREYLMALYSSHLLTRMRCCLQNGLLSLAEFCAKLSRIVWVPIEGDFCFNVNTKKDLEFLEKNNARFGRRV